MKKLLLAACAFGVLTGPGVAADMPLKAPPAVVPLWTWTGFYAGVNVGYSWGRSDTTVTVTDATTGALLAVGSSRFDLTGPIGGGQIGYNWQTGNWVLGIETDI